MSSFGNNTLAETLTPAEFQKAQEIWETYQRTHDLSGDVGRTAGVDPTTGEVWIGESIEDVVEKRKQAGHDSPLLFKRIGSATYYRKGGRR